MDYGMLLQMRKPVKWLDRGFCYGTKRMGLHLFLKGEKVQILQLKQRLITFQCLRSRREARIICL
ncbi:hypothetical protein Peur_039608 [Populus x canadensis]